MFKTELDHMHHREQIQDYLREAEHRHRNQNSGSRGRKAAVGAAAGIFFCLSVWGLSNLGQLANWLLLFK